MKLGMELIYRTDTGSIPVLSLWVVFTYLSGKVIGIIPNLYWEKTICIRLERNSVKKQNRKKKLK